MSANKASTESFITLLLEVSGKARPSDIQGVSSEDASAALQAYASTHSGEVRFEGDVLHQAAGGIVFEPEIDPYARQAQDPLEVSAEPVSNPYAAAEDPVANPYASAEATEPDPYSIPEIAPSSGGTGLPAHEAAMYETIPAAEPVFPEAGAVYEAAPVPVAEPLEQPQTIQAFPESADDFLDLPPLDAADAGDTEPGEAKKKPGLLIVLVVVLVVVVGLAAAFYLGAFETFGLSL